MTHSCRFCFFSSVKELLLRDIKTNSLFAGGFYDDIDDGDMMQQHMRLESSFSKDCEKQYAARSIRRDNH